MRSVWIMVAGCVVLGAAACGGGPDRRERVAGYLDDANAVQARWSGSFKSANEAYMAFSRSELSDTDAVQRLGQAESDIRAARAELGTLRPPADARALHDKLVRVFDMNIEFADQTRQLAAYVPAAESALAPLDAINRRLQRQLRRAGDAGVQARALAGFSSRLGRIVRELRDLPVPAVLRVSHGDQLRALGRTRSYAGRLRAALVDRDAQQVARLLEEFRRRPGSSKPRRKLAREAITRYNRRYQSLNDAYIEVRREEARLDKAFA
jgi:hypothetical protein